MLLWLLCVFYLHIAACCGPASVSWCAYMMTDSYLYCFKYCYFICILSRCSRTHIPHLQWTQKLKIHSPKKQVKPKEQVSRNIPREKGAERSPDWPQSKTGHWTDSGTDCSCHCSARAGVPARTCQTLAVTLIYAEEPCCFLFSQNVPHDKLESTLCFMRASWDRERATLLPNPG